MTGWPAMGPAADPLPGPRLALVVATNTYTDPELTQLRAPARDAEDLTQVLADPGVGEKGSASKAEIRLDASSPPSPVLPRSAPPPILTRSVATQPRTADPMDSILGASSCA